MSVQTPVHSDDLADALHALGVNFVLGGTDSPLHFSPARLISALAQSAEARLRLALIPLFLHRPEFAAQARPAAAQLPDPARLTLQCYYTAAMLFQKMHRTQIAEHLGEQAVLPDLFSGDLGLSGEGTASSRLEELAQRHRILSGVVLNWLGTYWHAADIWLKGLVFAKSHHESR